MIVVLLTPEQAEQLKGQLYAPDSYFNPIQDANDNWIISTQEQDQCSIDWVKELPLIEYIPKPTPNLLDNI
ncbi:hypothetical protein UFOVP1307_217 [uncultured Caudovirales phage]|uniref:Uncharacterized protein n=1 Tax=uncultured Caudovirales phage TaxID=2100421 RepID=A0A6J5NIN9_9CAUD|nr:hypothetical protein UFOVP651_129 [uncultured Caudovirales phage]CAB4171147.1 hypothetical protein UFOVP902_208 [uncultured Caudovirales phage]CAB4198694.1 hypothetical protein UFOVP1307_217 [uncultured Caudovirales phage]